jgi:hypothetical protein
MIIYLLFPLGRRVVKKGCGNLGTQSSIYDERERKKEERWREEGRGGANRQVKQGV